MDFLSSSDAKREFGELLLKAQKGPVGINKNGKPAAVLMSTSAYADYQRLKQQTLQYEIDRGLADIRAGKVVDGADVIDQLRKRVLDADI